MEKTPLEKRIKNYESRITKWIRKNPRETITLLVIIFLAAFLRLYKIDQYMTFLGDEGRDAIIVRRLLVEFDPILVGPGTSIGNMYLGPLYYYLIAPALFLANLSPVGPSVFVALIGVITVWMVWYITRSWFGKAAGIIASLVYALSPTVIVYSTSSWNPNVMPFFALICIWAIWKLWNSGSYKWLLVLGVSFAFVMQSHYLGLLLVPVLALFWILTLFKVRRSKKDLYKLLKSSFASLAIFIVLMSPLVIFDARHGWRNFSAMKTFFSERQTTVSAKPWSALPNIIPIWEDVSTRLLAGRTEWFGMWMAGGLIVAGVFVYFRGQFARAQKRALFLIVIWLIAALVGLGLYKQEIYDHYYGFFFPAPYILLGAVISKFWQKSFLSKVLFIGVFGLVVYVSLINNPFRFPPAKHLQRTKDVAQIIREASNDEKFNLAVVAERNYEDGYQYYLERWRLPVVDIDPQIQETVAEQLFIVCELPKDKCSPTTNPKAQVANFGWSKVVATWEQSGVTIFKLEHFNPDDEV